MTDILLKITIRTGMDNNSHIDVNVKFALFKISINFLISKGNKCYVMYWTDKYDTSLSLFFKN